MTISTITEQSQPTLSQARVEELRLTASKKKGAERRAFIAEVAMKYTQGNARLTETIFGWGRKTVEVGLAEKRTGIICLGAQSAYSGRKCWEQTHPEVAEALQQLIDTHAQQDPKLPYSRLTAKAALEALRAQGFAEKQLPCPSTMAQVLNRMGYRLRRVCQVFRAHDDCSMKSSNLPERHI